MELLRDDAFCAEAVATGTSVLFYHAVNPHGFSHGRRVNEDNIDLNRNFRDFSRPIPRNDAYADVHAFMLPADLAAGRRGARGARRVRRAHGATSRCRPR